MANSLQSTAHSSATDSSFKRQKLPNEEAKFNATIDRISSLPDSVLCHILSFLPTMHAFATSILSTRWRYLWTLVPSLDFDYETDNLDSDDSAEDRLDVDDAAVLNPVRPDGDRVGYMRFVHFVYRVLVLRNASCIKKFRLKCITHCDSFHFNLWVYAAISLDVEELDLYISLRQPVELPRILFTCKTLKVLKLRCDIILNVPWSIDFPNLKILHLIMVNYYQDEDSIRKLFSGCPVLQDLFIETSSRYNVQNFNISAPTLKKLSIEFDKHLPVTNKLEINAPALEYLNFKYFMPANFSIEKLSSLVEAKVDVHRERLQDAEYYGNCVFKLLKGLSNVKYLSLSCNTMEALSYASNDDLDLPMFHNLSQLEMGIGCNDWHLLPKLLESSHNLQVLALTEGAIYPKSCFVRPQHVPICLLLHLTTIDIREFKGKIDELEFVRYVLKNAKVLKIINICCDHYPSWKAKFLLLKKISMFPRASKTCRVAFC